MSIRQKLQSFVKYNGMVYVVYYHVASVAMRLVGRFVRTDASLVLFNSYAGRKYDDSPKAVYEAMRSDPRFSSYRVVWAFHDPDAFEVPDAEKIRTDTPRYFLTALRARVWLTNSSVERGLRFKKRGTLYVNTWHGTPIKQMGTDVGEDNKSFRSRGTGEIDAFCVQGEYEAEIFGRAFCIPEEKILRSGLPRNDELARADEGRRRSLRASLGIPDGRRVVLYCPTFREYDQVAGHAVAMKPPMDLGFWERELGETHVLLVRAHYEVTRAMEIADSPFVKDVSAYPSLNELIIASDVLVSDYSSVFFDYSITGKPMLHFCYDYDEYQEKRGMYFDVREWLSGSATEKGLIDALKSLDVSRESVRTMAFRNRFVDYSGNASRIVLDRLYELLNEGR